MGDHTKRELLKRTGYAMGASSIIAGCMGNQSADNETQSPDESTGNPQQNSTPGSQDLGIQIGMPTAGETDVQTWYGLLEIAQQEFGLDAQAKVLEGSDIMIQSTLAGEVQGYRAGANGIMPIVEQGRPFNYIFSDTSSSDYVLVGRPEFETLDDVVNKEASIGMASSISGLSGLQVVAVLKQTGVIDSVDEVRDQFTAVGYTSQRMAALINGDLDVSPQRYTQWLSMKEENPDFNLISTFADDLEKWESYGFNATPETIDSHEDEWVAAMKGVMLSVREMTEDFDKYHEMVQKYVQGGGPDEDVLRTSWEFIKENEFWPKNGGVKQENIEFMAEVMADVGVLEEPLAFEDVADRSLLDRALDEIGEA